MDIKDQVCSFEQAKKLCELGISQMAKTFSFVSGHDECSLYELVYSDGYEWDEHPGYRDYLFKYAAFTVAELGVMLGPIGAHNPNTGSNEAIERAEGLILCIEKGKLSINDINNRLNS